MKKLILLISMCGISSVVSAGDVVTSDVNDSKIGSVEIVPINYHIGVATHFVRKMKSMAHWNPEVFIPKIAKMHVGWIRDEIMWGKVERVKGVYAIPPEDMEWINLANKYGIKIIITFNGNNLPIYRDEQFPVDAYSNAATYVAQQLQGKIAVIEVLNEPFNWYANSFKQGTQNSGNIYGTTSDGRAESWMKNYVQLLNATADKIKSKTSKVKVIGLGGFPAMNWRMIKYGISKNVDGITLHPYSYTTTPEIVPYPDGNASFQKNGNEYISDKNGRFVALIEKMKKFSIEHSGPREMWLTEWGWTTKKNLPVSRGNYVGVTEKQQAVYIQRRFMESMGIGINASIVYSFMDDKNSVGIASNVNSEDNFGLLRSDGEPKPSYFAVQRLAALTANLQPTNSIEYSIDTESSRKDNSPAKAFDGTLLYALDGIVSYQFKNINNGHINITAWSMEKSSEETPRLANMKFSHAVKSIAVTDMLNGNKKQYNVSADGDKFVAHNVPVPANPILIELQE